MQRYEATIAPTGGRQASTRFAFDSSETSAAGLRAHAAALAERLEFAASRGPFWVVNVRPLGSIQ